MMSSDQNPYEPPGEVTSTVGPRAPSAFKLMLCTLAVTSGVGLLLIDRLFVLAIILLIFSGYVLMTRDERIAARRRYTEPLSGAQITQHFTPVLLVFGFLIFIGTDGFGSRITERPEFEIGIKALMVIAGLWMVCRHWWRWCVGATVAVAPGVTDPHND